MPKYVCETFHITKKEWGRIDRDIVSFSDLLTDGDWSGAQSRHDNAAGTILFEYKSKNGVMKFLAIPGPKGSGHDGDYHITIKFIPV